MSTNYYAQQRTGRVDQWWPKVPKLERKDLEAALKDNNYGSWVKFGGPEAKVEDRIEIWANIAKAPDANGNPKDYIMSSYDAYFKQFIAQEWDGDKIPSYEFIGNVIAGITDDPIRAKRISDLRDELDKWDVKPDQDGDEAFMGALFDLLGAIINLPGEYLPAYLDPIVKKSTDITWKYWNNRYTFIKPQNKPLVTSFQGILAYTYTETPNNRRDRAEAQQEALDELPPRQKNPDNDPAIDLANKVLDEEEQRILNGDPRNPPDMTAQEALKNNDKSYFENRLRESTQCILRLNLGSYTDNHSAHEPPKWADSPVKNSPRYHKSIYLGYGTNGHGINKLTYDPHSNSFMDMKSYEASQLTPMIRLYKTYFNEETNRIDKDVELYFDGGTSQGSDDDIFRARSGVGIKSFDWTLNGTNVETTRNDIEATLVLYFQNFNDLLRENYGLDTISGQAHIFKYEDLLLRPPMKASKKPTKKKTKTNRDDSAAKDKENLSSSKKEIKSNINKNVYDPRFYEIKAVVGWAPNNKMEHDTKGLPKSVRNQQLPLFLTLIDHEFTFTQEGTFELKITYRARMESIASDPRTDVLSTPDLKEKVSKLLEGIENLKATCGSETSIKQQQSEIARITEQSRDSLASAIIQELQDKIYFTKIRSKTEFLNAIAGDPGPAWANYEGKTAMQALRVRTEDVLASINATQDELRESVKKASTKSLVDSFSPDHPAAKKEAEEKEKESAGVLPDLDAGVLPDVLDGDSAPNAPSQNTGFLADPTDPEAMYIPWFYFGDLINTVVKFAMGPNGANSESQLSHFNGVELENLNFLFCDFLVDKVQLGAVDFNSRIDDVAIQDAIAKGLVWRETVNRQGIPMLALDESIEKKIVNLASVPISVEVFNQWFIKKVVDPGLSEYPLQNFLRDVTQDIVVATLNKNCFDVNNPDAPFLHAWRQVYDGAVVYRIPKLIFRTTTITLPSMQDGNLKNSAMKNSLGTNPLETIRAWPDSVLEKNNIRKDIYPAAVVDFGLWEPSGNRMLVKRENASEQTLKNSYHVGVYYVLSEDVSKAHGPPIGDETRVERDNKNGIFHLYIGRDRGIVKEINFSKNDAPYLREARIQQKSLNPLAQLAAVYNVDMTLLGNTIFWPGQYVYVNPRGLGAGIGDPPDKDSVANQLGLGGYHQVIGVTNFIESGKFETKVKALYQNSGDGEPPLDDGLGGNSCSVEATPKLPTDIGN